MKWIHISDLHFNFKNYNTEELREKLISFLENEKNIDFIIITGDIVYQYGKNEDSEGIINYIKRIKTACGGDSVDLYLCPGNHDINRNDINRNEIIDQIRENGLIIDNSSVSMLLELGHEKFKNIYREITGNRYYQFGVSEVNKNGNKYRIINLDTCLLSKDGEDDGKISLQTSKLFELNNKIKEDEYLNIVIMHHGIDFFEWKAGRAFQHWLEDCKVDVVFCGHSHHAGIKTYDETKIELKQFTCGAAIIDDYAIPSFFVCDFNETDWSITNKMYTYSLENSNWGMDNHHLRAFENGIYKYYIPRRYKKILGEKEGKKEYNVEQIIEIYRDFLKELNERVYKVYGREIRSSKLDSKEEFSVQKILKSLVKIGIPIERILFLLEVVVNEITQSKYYEKRQGFISTGDIRTCVYNQICNMTVGGEITNYDINDWAGKYARRYGHNNNRMKMLMPDGKEEVLSYNFIIKTLLKDVVIKVTGDNEYYESMLRNELNYMAEEVILFLKNCNLYCIQYEILVDFVSEIATETPHPWLISDSTKKNIIEYNRKTLEKHLEKIRGKREEITVLEALYHAAAIIVSFYTLVIGSSETSPINNLAYSIKKKNTRDKLPIKKNNLLLLENELVRCGFEWSKFCILINEIYMDTITNHDFNSERIMENILTLSDVALALISLHEIEREIDQTAEERISLYFSVKEGFVVKKPLQELKNCFWVTPNWSKEECEEYDLKKQILVIVIQNGEEKNEELIKYLEKKKEQCKDLIFFKENASRFTKNEKEMIKSFVGKGYFRNIFMDEEKMNSIESNGGLRNELLNIISSI